MINKTQILKGILEGCILSLLSKEKLYSQELTAHLSAYGLIGISDGTLFPLLLRLENEGLIASEKVPISNGPCRKYYTVTASGLSELYKFSVMWSELSFAVNEIIEEGENDDKA